MLMAHSLGNMVVSSMMQDYGLAVSKYLMCDSAVPSAAYYPSYFYNFMFYFKVKEKGGLQ